MKYFLFSLFILTYTGYAQGQQHCFLDSTVFIESFRGSSVVVVSAPSSKKYFIDLFNNTQKNKILNHKNNICVFYVIINKIYNSVAMIKVTDHQLNKIKYFEGHLQTESFLKYVILIKQGYVVMVYGNYRDENNIIKIINLLR
jgi:hypothetical protein